MFDEAYEKERQQYLDERVPPLNLEHMDEGLLLPHVVVFKYLLPTTLLYMFTTEFCSVFLKCRRHVYQS